MEDKGKAIMGTGEAEGEDRAVKAAEQALSNPLWTIVPCMAQKAS